MSENVVIAIVTAVLSSIPPTLMALAALRQGRQNGVKQAENTVLTEAVAQKTGALVETTAQIHELTNSNLTAVKSDLAVALAQIKSLQELVSAMAQDKKDQLHASDKEAILRASVKSAEITGTVPIPPQTVEAVTASAVGQSVTGALNNIDKNTEAIMVNTAKNAADVQALKNQA